MNDSDIDRILQELAAPTNPDEVQRGRANFVLGSRHEADGKFSDASKHYKIAFRCCRELEFQVPVVTFVGGLWFDDRGNVITDNDAEDLIAHTGNDHDDPVVESGNIPCKACNRPIVIGLSGSTRCGKSSLACKLSRELQCEVVNGDRFFQHIPWDETYNMANWEVPQALNWDAFYNSALRSIDAATQRCKICQPASKEGKAASLPAPLRFVIVESFLLNKDPRIVQLCDVHIRLVIPKELCRARRRLCEKNREDAEFETYFNKILWPAFVENSKNVLQELPNMYVIDGSQDAMDVFNEAQAFIAAKTEKLKTKYQDPTLARSRTDRADFEANISSILAVFQCIYSYLYN